MPRTRDTDATRLRLSEAVFTTLADRGPVGLTLRAVAERAGCTTGLVLHTFPNKQALLLHARDVLHERTRLRADRVESDASDPAAALRAVVAAALPTDEATLAEARVWIGFLAAALSDPVLVERHADNSGAFADRLARLLTSADESAGVAGATETGATEAGATEAGATEDGATGAGATGAGATEAGAAGDVTVRAAALAAAVEGVSSLAAGDPERWPPVRQRAVLDRAVSDALGRRLPG